MATLIVIGLLAGVITAISPCVLPVLPILLAGSAAGPPRRPYAIVAGLVASFTVFTLFAAALLDALDSGVRAVGARVQRRRAADLDALRDLDLLAPRGATVAGEVDGKRPRG